MLDVLRTTSLPPSNMHLLPEDNENDVFSTPPTTPMISSSFAQTEIINATGTSTVSTPDTSTSSKPSPVPSRRSSRPSSLHLAVDDKRVWTADVLVETGSVAASDNAESDGSKPSYRISDDLSASSPTQSESLIPNNSHQPKPSPLSQQRGCLSAGETSAPEAHKMQEAQNSNNNNASATATATANTSTTTIASIGSTDTASTSAGSTTVTQQNYPPTAGILQHPRHSHHKQSLVALKSPCFVHSFLDKGASLADWLKGKQHNTPGVDSPSPISPQTAIQPLDYNMSQPDVGQTQTKNSHGPYVQVAHPTMPMPLSKTSPGSSSESEFDEEEEGASLTRQLAETAVGVREMSKQLGRARIRSNIQNVLIITKARDNRLIKLTRELALYLMLKPRNDGRGLVVYVDNQLRYSKRFDAAGIQRDHPELFVPFPRRRSSGNNGPAGMSNGSGNSSSSSSSSENSANLEGQLRYWTSEMCSKSPHLFDFVVTLGGDGTVLFTSWLFQRIVPPVLPFALGSLGFLTNFDFADHRAVMDSAIDNGIRVNLRMRFTCTVYRATAPEPGKGRCAIKKADTGEIMMRNLEKGGWEALEGGWGEGVSKECKRGAKDKEIMCFSTRPVESFEVLNDLVVDRGPSPYMSLLELFGDEHHMTTVQADGLTVATPTGSTAYSLSAGGSLVHPEIPAILITPICPHTLSFRPMLLPDSMELRICVPFNSRSTAWASFDGRGRIELKQGDHIKVTASKYPFPTVCADKQSTDWFHAISRTLKWNERERQKSFVVVEEGPARRKTRRQVSKNDIARSVAKHGIAERPEDEQEVENEEEDEVSDDGEEEEEKFDIDDSSAPEASRGPSSADLVAMAKAQEEARQKEDEEAREAAFSLAGTGALHDRSGTISRSGIETPDRFVAAHPHPRSVSPRHIAFANGSGSETPGQMGDRDHIHSPRMLSSARSRIPRDRDLEAESASMKTPTMASWSAGGGERVQRSRSKSREPASVGRAFAVWGQDESDSNASDSDV